VRYTVKGTIDKGLPAFNHVTVQVITVLSALDLNQEPQAMVRAIKMMKMQDDNGLIRFLLKQCQMYCTEWGGGNRFKNPVLFML
jgi:hypothetical protein